MKKQRKPDRRIRRTRRQLHGALHRLIKKQAYDTITVSDIVEEADISRATFYLHYKDKDELLIHSLQSVSEKLIDTLKTDTTSTDLESITNHIFAHVQDNRHLYQALQNSYRASFVIQHQVERLAEVFQIHLTSTSSSDPTTVDRQAHQLAGALYGLILWWLKHDLDPSAEVMAQQFVADVGGNNYNG